MSLVSYAGTYTYVSSQVMFFAMENINAVTLFILFKEAE